MTLSEARDAMAATADAVDQAIDDVLSAYQRYRTINPEADPKRRTHRDLMAALEALEKASDAAEAAAIAWGELEDDENARAKAN